MQESLLPLKSVSSTKQIISVTNSFPCTARRLRCIEKQGKHIPVSLYNTYESQIYSNTSNFYLIAMVSGKHIKLSFSGII